jgi:hypothetical protein
MRRCWHRTLGDRGLGRRRALGRTAVEARGAVVAADMAGVPRWMPEPRLRVSLRRS